MLFRRVMELYRSAIVLESGSERHMDRDVKRVNAGSCL